MTAIERYLSGDLHSALKALADDASPNWWQETVRSELILALRGGYLNAYHRGQSVLKIGPRVQMGTPSVTIHYKYLVKPELEESDPYISFNGTRFAVPDETLQRDYRNGTTLKQLIRVASRFAGDEKTGVSHIAGNEPKLIDLEIAFSLGVDDEAAAPRIDLAVLVPRGDKEAHLVFCEAKRADNAELWTPSDPRKKPRRRTDCPSVVAQIEEYEQFLSANEAAVSSAYHNVCQALIELRAQGYNRVDPIVEEIASKGRHLIVHPKVFLLVYDYDSDQLKGAVTKRMRVLENDSLLGNRIIKKGDPKQFRLSNDIIRATKGMRF